MMSGERGRERNESHNLRENLMRTVGRERERGVGFRDPK